VSLKRVLLPLFYVVCDGPGCRRRTQTEISAGEALAFVRDCADWFEVGDSHFCRKCREARKRHG